MPRRWISLPAVCVLVALCVSSCGREREAQPAGRTLSVLWIGNSDTQSGPLYEMAARMVNGAARGIRLRCEASVHGGRDLKYHYEKTDALERISRGAFDYVVLQPYATRALADDFREATEYAGRFIGAIRAGGAEPVLCSIWAEMEKRRGKWEPAGSESWDRLVRFHEDLARARACILAPTCLAWREVLDKNPPFPMYMADGIHPSAEGAYLNACVFYSVFTGEAPLGHPMRESMPYVGMNPLLIELSRPFLSVTLDEPTARFLQRAAWEAIRHYRALGDIRVCAGRAEDEPAGAAPNAAWMKNDRAGL